MLFAPDSGHEPIISDARRADYPRTAAWQPATANAINKSRIERFTFHDLKRKGVSDFSGDKLLASGHHSAFMLSIYDVSIGTIPATK